MHCETGRGERMTSGSRHLYKLWHNGIISIIITGEPWGLWEAFKLTTCEISIEVKIYFTSRCTTDYSNRIGIQWSSWRPFKFTWCLVNAPLGLWWVLGFWVQQRQQLLPWHPKSQEGKTSPFHPLSKIYKCSTWSISETSSARSLYRDKGQVGAGGHLW